MIQTYNMYRNKKLSKLLSDGFDSIQQKFFSKASSVKKRKQFCG